MLLLFPPKLNPDMLFSENETNYLVHMPFLASQHAHLVDFVNEKSSSNQNIEYCHSEISFQDMSDDTYFIHYEKNATGRTIRQHTIPYYIENGNHFRILPTSIYPKRDDLQLVISLHIRDLCDHYFPSHPVFGYLKANT